MMERDVNLKLVYIILVLLLALASISVFYQIRYENMKSGYEKSFEEMNHTLNDIMIKQKGLDDNVSASREVALTAKLELKTVELDNVNRELESIKQELFECRENYISSDINFDRLQGMINGLKTHVENNESKSVIFNDIKDIQNELIILKSI